jgi:hypothetical protein
MKAFGGRGIFATFLDSPLAVLSAGSSGMSPFLGGTSFVSCSAGATGRTWGVTLSTEPPNVGVRMIRRALIDSSTNEITGAQRRALLTSQLHLYCREVSTKSNDLPEPSFDLVHIVLPNHIHNVYRQKNLGVGRLEVVKRIFPQQLRYPVGGV